MDVITRLRPHHMTASFGLRVAVGVLAVLAVALAITTRLTTTDPTTANQLIGKPAPAFALTAEQSGHMLAATVSLAQQRGHTVLLYFTYSLCAHCLTETAVVHDIQRQDAPNGLRVLYLDSPAETTGIVAAYADRLGLSDPVLLDPNGLLASTFGIHYYPAVVLIDPSGITRQVWTGETSATTLRAAWALPSR